MKKREAVISGFSATHQERNSNTFYCMHPELHEPFVDVKFPDDERFDYFAGWQAMHKAMYTNLPENYCLEDILRLYEAPRHIVELGCGVGRGSVWLCRYYGWDKSTFWLLDSTGDNVAYGVDEEGCSDYYNDLELTKAYWELNCPGVKYHVVDTGGVVYDVPDEIDLLFSFLAFGFHWDFNPYLESLQDLVVPGGLAVFGMRGFDQGGSHLGPGGCKARRFTEKQIAGVDSRYWTIVRDARLPEARKASVLVLRRKK